MLMVVAPPIFILFGLLAGNQAMGRLGGRDLKLADFRHLNILLPYLVRVFWFVAGYALARFGEEMIETIADQLYDCVRELYSAGRARIFLYPPDVSGYVVVLFVLTWWFLSILGQRRYSRERTVGVSDVLLIWLAPALIYWVGTGIYIYSTFTRYRPLYHQCNVSLF